MRLSLEATVRTRDGEDIGTIEAAVFDPTINELTHIVVSTGPLFGRAIEIPREELARATDDGDVLHLQLTRDEVAALPAAAPGGYEAPPPTWIPPAAYGIRSDAFLWPAAGAPAVAPVAGGAAPTGRVADAGAPADFGGAMPETAGAPTGAGVVTAVGSAPPVTGIAPGSTLAAENPGAGAAGPDATSPDAEQETQPGIGISQGASVVDRNGEDIGVVDDVRFDPQSGRLEGFVMRAGGVFSTLFGGGETAAISAEQIEEVGESTVYLSVSKDDLAAVVDD